MAAPSYTEDLTDIDLAESTSGWSAIGSGGMVASSTFSMQGTNSIERGISGSATRGALYANGSTFDLTGGRHVYVWGFAASPGAFDTIANGGARVIIGDSTTAYVEFHVEGDDTYGAGGRVGRCYPIDFVNTSNGSPPYRTLVGSPGTSPDSAGMRFSSTATAKFSVDAIRVGTGAYLTAGEIGDAATFDGFATQNDSVSNRWGILTSFNGAYELQGKFAIGQNNSQVATLCYFDDSAVDIIIPDTIHAASDFSEIIIDHASTTCIWDTINIKALGTTNRGTITVTSNNPSFTVTGGVYTSIDTTVLRSNSTITGVTWRDSDSITLNGATLTDCVVDENRASSAMLCDDLGDINTCSFISDGTGHAVELSSVGGGSMDWDSSLTGYAGTDGSTGNEAIYVNVGSGSLTINVQAGADTPTIRTAGATVTVSVAPVTIKITVTDDAGTAIQNARVRVTATETVGTITDGDVILEGLTDVSGIIQDTSFTYESAFDPSGLDIRIKARQGSVAPFKVPSTTTGTVVDVTGYNAVVALQPDE